MPSALTNSNKKKRSLHHKLLALAAVVGMATTVSQATATSTVTDTVQLIEYMEGTLIVQTGNSVNYYGQLVTQAGCTHINKKADTLKAWQGLAQAALLSGKSVRIYYDTCNSIRYIYAIDLIK